MSIDLWAVCGRCRVYFDVPDKGEVDARALVDYLVRHSLCAPREGVKVVRDEFGAADLREELRGRVFVYVDNDRGAVEVFRCEAEDVTQADALCREATGEDQVRQPHVGCRVGRNAERGES